MKKNQLARLAWKQLQQPVSGVYWRRQLFPGLTVVGLVFLVRLLGLLQVSEWKTYDNFLRSRPAEPTEDRILIVDVTEDDIQQMSTYPIPDRTISALLEELSQANPRAIGVDIYRDLPVEPGHDDLVAMLSGSDNIVGIESITGALVLPPPALPPEQVGFVDFPLDADGFVRRAYLGALPPEGYLGPSDDFRFSFAFTLVEIYLAEENILLENGLKNSDNMRLGKTEFFSLSPNAGGYVGTEIGGEQILLNPRSGRSPFERVSMGDVLAQRVPADKIENRVVLVGVTASSIKDVLNSGAVSTANPGLVDGVEMHAHMVSQLLSSVLGDRPLIKVWPEPVEYLWILMWGGVSVILVRCIPRPSWYMLTVGVISLGLVGVSFGLLWWACWWVPVVPALIVFSVNGWVLPAFYLYDQAWRARVDEHQRVIKQTYDTIHNGPLQMLALLLQDKRSLKPQTAVQLEQLNDGLRQIYDRLLQETLSPTDKILLGNQSVVDLRSPLHEVLYQVYKETLTRSFPGFAALTVKVVRFDPFQTGQLSSDQKKGLCRFLEEALCNAGKHAVGAKRLCVTCLATETENLIRVEDNAPAGKKGGVLAGGRGTQQAKALARQLQGSFQRVADNAGTRCELRWPLKGKRSTIALPKLIMTSSDKRS
ncbi:hypothetical protein S7335_1125 [Synechococcus sp. PCC 7335]|uniref:sensor histidine kinase n=1 Tax=Synechococcus sp. (strain ATCC 29403 / PCC 7335) TaxID=91464 RepID=UPI00017ED2D9|nr:CHASE2 domain-containing protein [Synechococcus sp. PCC 7335]EDX82822.1 hypothetical protein S7335_1125 [Synechococcus sp. PCC 7335]